MRDIQFWLSQAEKQKAKFVISVCDTFDYSDYAVYCKDEKDLEKQRKQYDGMNMQRINEVIDTSKYKKLKGVYTLK